MSIHAAMWAAINEEDESLSRVAEATKERLRAQTDWELALVEASRTNSLRAIERVAGVSHARVAQIIGGRRG